jgi:hypothetical protein
MKKKIMNQNLELIAGVCVCVYLLYKNISMLQRGKRKVSSISDINEHQVTIIIILKPPETVFMLQYLYIFILK